jgi:RHS repeat-associated protein
MHGTQISTSAYGNRFTFQGREYLAAVNVYDFRSRAYSPDLGRFLQMDPIGFGGGNSLYRFVGNNPVTGTDPTGRLIVYIAFASAPGLPLRRVRTIKSTFLEPRQIQISKTCKRVPPSRLNNRADLRNYLMS